jgi:hypothetical protein
MITYLESGITDGVNVSLVSINVWRLAGNILNITCNFLYCNHQMHRDFLITLYKAGLFQYIFSCRLGKCPFLYNFNWKITLWIA